MLVRWSERKTTRFVLRTQLFVSANDCVKLTSMQLCFCMRYICWTIVGRFGWTFERRWPRFLPSPPTKLTSFGGGLNGMWYLCSVYGWSARINSRLHTNARVPYSSVEISLVWEMQFESRAAYVKNSIEISTGWCWIISNRISTAGFSVHFQSELLPTRQREYIHRIDLTKVSLTTVFILGIQ